jgi:diguanylate cyclase (GGDEF)-like protein/PAS domain S-box-containing protein
MVAPLPEDEGERLEALRQTGLLDSIEEEEFDNLARLAAVICETPIASVTLVDRDRQWFKAMVGIDDRETHRDFAFCAHTILQSETLVVADASKDPRFAENPLVTGDPLIRFYAGVPLEDAGGYRLGAMCVIDRKPRELTAAQLEGLAMIAEQAKKLINLRRQQNMLDLAMGRSLLIDQKLRVSQDLFHAFMDHSPFVAFLKDAEGRMVYYNQRCADWFHIDRDAWLGKSDAELWPPELADKLRANDRLVLRQWKALTVEEETGESNGGPSQWRSYKFPFRDSDGREHVASFAMDVSLEKQERQVQIYQRELEEANAKLLELAVTDGLTGLRNRRAFETSLEHEYEVSRRYGHPLALLILDIDNFKYFNDTFGHQEGDRILRCVASGLGNRCRSTDIVARYGGEEFAIILPNTAREPAAELAERLRRAVSDCELHQYEVTISIGLATLDDPDLTQDEFVRQADNALYLAKREGKNRVCVA